VSLILTSAAELRRLNREFLGKDRDTDVITFDYTEPPRDPGARRPGNGLRPRSIRGKGGTLQSGSIWGDVYVSAEAAREQARERAIPVREELARLFLHGCLHLLGHRDGTRSERVRMERAQESLLPDLLARPAPRATGLRRTGARTTSRRRPRS
jgi:probable rRNA maturation factor